MTEAGSRHLVDRPSVLIGNSFTNTNDYNGSCSCFLFLDLISVTEKGGWLFIIPCLDVRTSLYTVSVPFPTGAVAEHTITDASEQ